MNLKLSDPVTKLPYVGETYANRLKRLGIKTVRDLLYHFPFRYQDFSQVKKIRDLFAYDETAISGRVIKVEVVRAKTGKLLTKAVIADETGAVEVIWFNQPYLAKTIKEGREIHLAGKVESFGGRLTFVSPEFELIKEGKALVHTQGLVPIYPETGGVSSKWLRTRIKDILRAIPLENPEFEFLPDEILQNERFPRWGEALNTIHFPPKEEKAQEAKRRFAFEELFLLNLRSLERRKSWQTRRLTQKIAVSENKEKIEQFINNLPFKLTEAQQRVVTE
ncbi:DNA helicase RecG, partial [candidate division WWE3 bacterium CG_4_10_14_0_2_um_filter_47_8]